MVGAPVRFNREPFAYSMPAPELGADTRSVLHELGFSDAEIDGLVAEGVAIAS